MRCYYDQQIFMSQANGGISRYFFELVRRLGETDGFEPTVFAGFYLSQLPLRTLRHCRVIGLRRSFKVGPLYAWAVRACDAANRRLLRTLAPAIYHPTYYFPTPPPGGARRVITVYDMIHERFPQYYPGNPTAELKRAACTAADAIICISESTRRDLLEFYPRLEAKTSVVHLAVAADFGAIRATPAAPPGGGRPYALFVGGRQDYKGFDVTMDAWQALRRTAPDLRLICVGGGAFTAAETAEIRRRGLEAEFSQVTASDARLAEWYRGAVVFLYPSRYEGFGLPVLEAMACGCPVVCCRSSSLPEIGGEAASYFEPGDADGLAGRVARMTGDADYRAGFVRAGGAQHRKFSWERCAEQTAAIYRACVSAR